MYVFKRIGEGMQVTIYISDESVLESIREAAGEKSVSSYLVGLHWDSLGASKKEIEEPSAASEAEQKDIPEDIPVPPDEPEETPTFIEAYGKVLNDAFDADTATHPDESIPEPTSNKPTKKRKKPTQASPEFRSYSKEKRTPRKLKSKPKKPTTRSIVSYSK